MFLCGVNVCMCVYNVCVYVRSMPVISSTERAVKVREGEECAHVGSGGCAGGGGGGGQLRSQ